MKPLYEIVDTPVGRAVLLDENRAYSTPMGDKLIVTDRATRATIAAITGPRPGGYWSHERPVEIEYHCYCGQCE